MVAQTAEISRVAVLKKLSKVNPSTNNAVEKIINNKPIDNII